MSRKLAVDAIVPSAYAVTVERTVGALLLSCPDIPEMHAVAYEEQRVVPEALDAIETALVGYMQDRRVIPVPRRTARGKVMVYLPTLTMAKLALYNAVLGQRLSKAELARRLGTPRPSVDRLLDLRHSSRMDQVDAALECLGQRIELQVLAA